jgi:hypothetical protein
MDELCVDTSPSSLILLWKVPAHGPAGAERVGGVIAAGMAATMDRRATADGSRRAARRSTKRPLNAGVSSGAETDAHEVTEAASTACATLPTWVISTLRGLACSATGMVMVSTPSW